MIKSMTGFGRAQELLNGRSISVEIRSINHRYSEFSFRVSRGYGFLENRLKGFLQEKFSRGKVDVSVQIQSIEAPDTLVQINKPLAESYVQSLRSAALPLGLIDDLSLRDVIGFPDVFTVCKSAEDEETVCADVLQVASAASEQFVKMRETEGEKLKDDIQLHLDSVLKMVSLVEERSPVTVKEYREKLYRKISEVLEGRQIDDQRILTEAAIYAEKIAVDEETVRLRSHIEQFRNILEQDGPVGKKLDFLIQEFNRETNTIGSKAQDLAIAQIVVEMKSEIEKIREQIQNIE